MRYILAIIFLSFTKCYSDPMPLWECQVSEEEELGLWHDAMLIPEEEAVLLRLDEKIFRLSAGESEPELLAQNNVFENSRFRTIFKYEGQIWFLANDGESFPYAFNLITGNLVHFSIPDLAIPGSHTPGIQSYQGANHSRGIVLTISGGDKESWPRDGNRPIYFWFSLESGNVVRMPTGWDLDYFSPTMDTAYFDGAKSDPETFRRAIHAIHMESGEQVDHEINRRMDVFVPYNWSDHQFVKPCYIRCGLGDSSYLAGISDKGDFIQFSPEYRQHYITTRQRLDDYVAFRTMNPNRSRYASSNLWIVSWNSNQQPTEVHDRSTDLALLANGNLVFTTNITDPELEQQGTVFEFPLFRNYKTKEILNILQDLEMFPPLDPKFFKDRKKYPERISTELIISHGNPKNDPYVMVISRHSRPDYSALRRSRFILGVIVPEIVQRTVTIKSNGDRFLLPLFSGDGRLGLSRPDIIWPMHSGTILTGVYEWENSGQESIRKVRLSSKRLILDVNDPVSDEKPNSKSSTCYEGLKIYSKPH